MQANYLKKLHRPCWDPVNLNYPVRKSPTTGVSSETTGRVWLRPPEVLPALSVPVCEERDYMRDYNVTKDLLRSQSSLDFCYKISEATRLNKHTACNENKYIYPPSKKLVDRIPKLSAHGTSEMKSAFTVPTGASRLVTNKVHSTLPLDMTEKGTCYKKLEPLDTTHDGFEKYLDPYLTTNRLHHRPFTVEQQDKQSNSKDVLTYYTYSDIPWVRSPKPNINNCLLPVGKAKPVYDREKFKKEFREIRTHKRPKWIPRAFRTENLDNYGTFNHTGSQIHNYEEEVRSLYQRYYIKAALRTNRLHTVTNYDTESSQIGLRKPICAVFDQYLQKNKRL